MAIEFLYANIANIFHTKDVNIPLQNLEDTW